MSFSCGVEWVVLMGCTRWAWKRCTHVGSDDSATWPLATPEEFETVPRVCRLILAVYEADLRNPQYAPPGGYGLNPDWVVKRVTYENTQGHAPTYLIYLDRDHRQIVLAIRGMNLVKESDYKLLMDNRLGRQMFDGGYVHHGLLKSAIWLLQQESETLARLWEENGSSYEMVFAGHSLGSGVAALLTVIAVNHRDNLGGIPREKIRCYAVAPARCMSLNLAVKYADVIYSIVLQDDFLPRTATPLEDIFKSIFWLVFFSGDIMMAKPVLKNLFTGKLFFVELVESSPLNPGLDAFDSLPCLLFLVCLRDTFIPEGRKLRDPRRLYAPGRMYHIVERKFCRCGRFPPEVRTAIPVEGRFEHIVLTCNATSDHAIIWIERESEKALKRMKESGPQTVTTPPKEQKFERLQTIEKEHKDALERAVCLNVPHAVATAEDLSFKDHSAEPSESGVEGALEIKSKSPGGKTNWDEVVKRLFKRDESGELRLKEDVRAPE